MNTDLFNDLIQLQRIHTDEKGYVFSVKINPGNQIFVGHFPNMPILPGVVMMEIVKRATTKVVGINLSLQQSKSVKFLKLIEPNEVDTFDLHLNIEAIEKEFIVRAELSSNAVVYYKQIVNFKEK